MIEPKEGKFIAPHSKHMWARIVDGEVALTILPEGTVTFLEEIHRLYVHNELKLVKVELHSSLFPTLYFQDPVFNSRRAIFYYEDRRWNIQTSEAVILDANTIKETIFPFLTFLDEHYSSINYKLVVEYLGLNSKEEEE